MGQQESPVSRTIATTPGVPSSAPASAAELRWRQGNNPYLTTFRAERAGPFGCDPCWDCDRRPEDGQPVWQNNYGDLYCDPCAQRRAAREAGSAGLEAER